MNNSNSGRLPQTDIRKVAVIGSGVMGKAIHYFLESALVDVQLISARGLLEDSQNSYLDLAKFDLIIECCVEDLEAKKIILDKISKANLAGIIGTCTSSLSVSELQAYVQNPARFCGIHFMNPPKAIRVVELIAGELTETTSIAKVNEFLLDLDREIFQILDSPGFAVNSILISMLNQAVYTLESCGLDPEKLDSIIKLTTGLKLGPLATIDLIGVDVTVRIIMNLQSANSNEFLPPAPRLVSMIEQGNLGRKTKTGFFDYA